MKRIQAFFSKFAQVLTLPLLFLATSLEAKAPQGDFTLLEPIGTTSVAETQEKILYTYTIRPGDTLWDISKWTLKNPFLWPELLKFNYIGNPNLIFPGDRLTIPSMEVLERVKTARDVGEIEAIRQDAEAGARKLELIEPPSSGANAQEAGNVQFIAVTATAAGLIRVPILEPVSDTQSATDLKISGRTNINFTYREYHGGASPYYYSSGYTRRETLNLTVNGKIENTVKVEGTFYQSDQELESQYALKLSTEHLELFLGDFQAQIPDTEFLLSGRNLSGGRFSAVYPTLGSTVLVGATKGIAQYDRFFGNRTQGPYTLKQAPVVYGSERVLIDKAPAVRGTDYVIDYLIGQITFLNRAIDDITQVEVAYESRQTVYPRALYGGRVWGKPLAWLRVAGSVLREEDPVSEGIINLPGGNTLTPLGHWIFGSDLSADLPGFGALTGEWATSRYQSNRLDSESLSQGQAGRAALGGSLGPIGLKSYYQRTTPDFRRIGGLEQGNDILGFGGGMDLKTGGPYSLGGSYDYHNRLLSGIRQIDEQAQGSAKIGSTGWPILGYQYFQLRQRNDAAGSLYMNYLTQRHTGLLDLEQDYFTAGVRAEQEQRAGQLSDRSTALTRSLALTAATRNVSWAAFTGGIEEQVVMAEGTSTTAAGLYRVAKADLTGSLTPSERYSLSANNRWVWDEQYGCTRTLDSKFEARPIDAVQADVKYAWETLQTMVISSYVPVYTQTVSGGLEITPWVPLSIRVAPSLRWTTLADGGQTLNCTRTDQGAVKWAATSQISNEVNLQRDIFTLADTTDPGLRLQTEQQNHKGVYLLKIAFSNVYSGDFSALYEQSRKSNYSLGLSDYDRLESRHRVFSLGLHSSFQEKWRLDASYGLDLRDQGGTSPQPVTLSAYPISTTGQTNYQYDLLNSYGTLRARQDTVSFKLTWQATEILSLYADGAYNRNEDLAGATPVIHTSAPGAGLTARWEQFRAEATSKWAYSWGGAATRQENYGLILSYTPISSIELSAQATRSYTQSPYSEATEANLNCCIQF